MLQAAATLSGAMRHTACLCLVLATLLPQRPVEAGRRVKKVMFVGGIRRHARSKKVDRPFDHARKRLGKLGELIPIDRKRSPAENQQRVEQALGKQSEAFFLVAGSAGWLQVERALIVKPELRRHLVGVLTVASPIQGATSASTVLALRRRLGAERATKRAGLVEIGLAPNKLLYPLTRKARALQLRTRSKEFQELLRDVPILSVGSAADKAVLVEEAQYPSYLTGGTPYQFLELPGAHHNELTMPDYAAPDEQVERLLELIYRMDVSIDGL